MTQTRTNYRPDFYLILAYSFQPLIDDGWEVDQFDEAVDDDQNDSNDGIESGLEVERPSKRRKFVKSSE
jgi:hypothetical protein